MSTYEVVREMFNECSRNQMRDVSIEELEAADPDEAVKRYLVGSSVTVDKTVGANGDVTYDCVIDGIKQQFCVTKL